MEIIDQILSNLEKSGKIEKDDNAYAYIAGMAFGILTEEQQRELLAISEMERG
jgi:hypothetical protein